MNHDIKCWPEYFRALKTGEKTFEFRKNDRGFKVGDMLDIEEYDPKPGLVGQYTGQIIHRTVNYVLDLGTFPNADAPILRGYAVLGLDNPEIVSLRAKNARLRAELEAAKKDLWFTRCCLNCKHCPPDYPSLHGACVECDDEDNWQWRGVPANTPAQGATDETRGGGEG